MSAALGTEALDVEEPPDQPSGDLTVPRSRPAAAAGPPASVRLPRLAAHPSGTRAWLTALRLPSLPAALLGACVALLLVLAEPAWQPVPAATAVVGLVVLHLITALLRALRDPWPGRAGPLRRVEAGRAVLGLAGLGVLLTGGLAWQRGWPALLLAGGGLAVAVVAARSAEQGARHRAVVVLATAAATAAVWWTAAGSVPWRVWLVAAVAGALLASVRTGTASRLLLAAPCAAVGVAVALQALPWPALLVGLALPAARRAAVAARPPAAPARLAVLLLLVGLGVALVTGTDLPLSAPR